MNEDHIKEHWAEIEALIKIAFEEGLNKAIQKAQEMNNPHLLDDFHDVLINRFYEELKTRGQIKE